MKSIFVIYKQFLKKIQFVLFMQKFKLSELIQDSFVYLRSARITEHSNKLENFIENSNCRSRKSSLKLAN
jgi:hypothetical protein